MASPEIDYSAIDAFEPVELLQLPETHSYRSRQSSLEVDRDNHGLLKSTPTVHSALSTTETDKGFVTTIKNIRQRLRGWRSGVLLSSAMANFVLVVNCVAAITIHSKYGTKDGVSTAFEGDRHVANQWFLGLHVVINALSSFLLSASNYTMQVINAPGAQSVTRRMLVAIGWT
ncbi:hypothetical protein WHR41_09067 [Cladosporium halotolerans]|uniref:DUF6536 domain-containing protein n=1 Tax=Cladosporium halotolerans TaxID=1052096 RepID=A0AB34KB68_9PEZI